MSEIFAYEVLENLRFFIECLKNLPLSRNLRLLKNGFCVSTGCDFESWVYYPERIENFETVEKALNFFEENKVKFLWPLYDDGANFLEKADLIHAGDLTAMSFEPKKIFEHDEKVLIKRCEDPKIFALTEWQGFGGMIEDIPERYFSFIEALSANKNLSLYIAEYEGKNAGTFLLVNETCRNSTGVYYFSVIPEFRRKGVAREMMKKICEISIGKKILLQATPSGLNFYRNFGFDELSKIPVYSTESDVF